MNVIYCVFILSILSCHKEDINPIEDVRLTGKWTETIEANPQGLIVYGLTINENATFILKISHFGTYQNQNNNDLSAWTEFSGTLEEKSSDSLIFKSEKHRWWDGFYDMTPITEASSRLIYEDCTYKIINNTLELSYTTYPADAPEETEMIFTKV